MTEIIHRSQAVAGWPIPWFVAQATYHSPDDSYSVGIRTAQRAVQGNGTAMPGADTDVLGMEFRDGNGRGVHFSGKGPREHGWLWAEAVSPWLGRQLAGKPDAAPLSLPPLFADDMILQRDMWIYSKRPGMTPETLPEFWMAQTAVLDVPRTGMVVANDLVDDLGNIHPLDKQEVARRLVFLALAGTYGRGDLVSSGPFFQSATAVGDKLRVRFAHADSGLATRDGRPPACLEVAGADDRFHLAAAEIDGQTLLVHRSEVPQPEAVRFAWSEEAKPNLINKESLPAAPFHSAKWPQFK